jgi:hypothetical protein
MQTCKRAHLPCAAPARSAGGGVLGVCAVCVDGVCGGLCCADPEPWCVRRWAQGVKFIIECEYFTGRVLEIDGGITL